MKQASLKIPTARDNWLEKIRSELNLEKWPIWQPAHTRRSPLNRECSQREIFLDNGSRVTAKVEIAPSTKRRLTTEDQTDVYALVKQWRNGGRLDTIYLFSLDGWQKLLRKKWGSNAIDVSLSH